MKLGPCFECDAPGAHMHHVVPAVRGGRRMLPLCEACHGKCHDLTMTGHVALVKAGIASRQARGLHVGRVPFGWRLDGAGALTEDEDEQGVLELARRWRADGLSAAACADALNAAGFHTRSACIWYASTIRRALATDESTRARVTG